MAKIKQTLSELRAKREATAYYKKLNKGKPKNKKAKRKKVIKKPPYESYAELKYMPYGDFLNSKYWKHVRQVVLKRDNNKCRVCGFDRGLQVHHENYKNRGNELKHLNDLITLCHKCHKEHHYAQA